jgi:hypothetical protein
MAVASYPQCKSSPAVSRGLPFSGLRLLMPILPLSARLWWLPVYGEGGHRVPSRPRPRRHIQEDEAEQHGWHPLILERPRAQRRMKLPVCDRHHARKDKCHGAGEQAQHNQDAAAELQHPADARLRHQRRGLWGLRSPPNRHFPSVAGGYRALIE